MIKTTDETPEWVVAWGGTRAQALGVGTIQMIETHTAIARMTALAAGGLTGIIIRAESSEVSRAALVTIQGAVRAALGVRGTMVGIEVVVIAQEGTASGPVKAMSLKGIAILLVTKGVGIAAKGIAMGVARPTSSQTVLEVAAAVCKAGQVTKVCDMENTTISACRMPSLYCYILLG